MLRHSAYMFTLERVQSLLHNYFWRDVKRGAQIVREKKPLTSLILKKCG